MSDQETTAGFHSITVTGDDDGNVVSFVETVRRVEEQRIDHDAMVYWYGRTDGLARRQPRLKLTAFCEAAIAERADHGELTALYNRMLAEGKHIVDGA